MLYPLIILKKDTFSKSKFGVFHLFEKNSRNALSNAISSYGFTRTLGDGMLQPVCCSYDVNHDVIVVVDIVVFSNTLNKIQNLCCKILSLLEAELCWNKEHYETH